MPELSLEDKLQAEFDTMRANHVLDKTQKYYFFYWIDDLKKSIIRINPDGALPGDISEQELKWIDEKRFVILEYSNKRSKWELSLPSWGK